MNYTIESARNIFSNTQVADAVPATTAMFAKLNIDDKLAFLWYAYTELGRTITPAAPGKANLQLMEGIFNQIKQMSHEEQTQLMRDLATNADTPISRSYAYFGVNAKLGFWWQLGEWMKQGIVAPMPFGYQMSTEVKAVLEAVQKIDQSQQITVLRNTVVDMGFDPAQSPKQEAEVINFTFPRTSQLPQSPIEGVTEPTVLKYIQAMNADNVEAAVALFANNGALQPPFQKPIVGREAITAYLRDEGQGLVMKPTKGISESIEDGYTQHKITGTVETPWFGGNVGMNIAWRFLLDPQGQIYFVAIDLLASPKELLNLVRK
ncbi:orange carotenoid protein N-terminal domain-containing protein [aff. Roholtiella sp. LEGE 12411]|uniref:orange carotenoid protein N-terminal domain-containing protein n=1 Tax=aff. Roholtiella sp. LEGE 12411 TaxID=1828822 RepID=UPI00187F029C|nr:orange carotenoid protein N-terminal domain-containing protein [aff. Roholtiella sp. LEGE 12411]MBE9037113.1 Red carotenoid-binding protein [aff. Roholtiella sp. LEGE 12411]